jgi:adenosylcobinamide kinase/adenosylcobinamide-phosphate guanylyltransferase
VSSGRLILVGGGARSGKSTFAALYAKRLAADAGLKPVFVATAQAFDGEMTTRIERHKEERDGAFTTVEEPLDVVQAVTALPGNDIVLLDCLTLWLSNLLLASRDDASILDSVDRLVLLARSRSGPLIVVSNEVGLGLVPESPLGRRFRDLAGLSHQRLSSGADEIYAGLMGLILRLVPTPIVSLRPGHLP